MANTWLCPICKRRVPTSLDECRCGSLRVLAVQAEAREAEKAHLPRDVWVALGVMALALILGVVWILLPGKRQRLPALLGYAASAPTPEPTKPPKPPASKNR